MTNVMSEVRLYSEDTLLAASRVYKLELDRLRESRDAWAAAFAKAEEARDKLTARVVAAEAQATRLARIVADGGVHARKRNFHAELIDDGFSMDYVLKTWAAEVAALKLASRNARAVVKLEVLEQMKKLLNNDGMTLTEARVRMETAINLATLDLVEPPRRAP
jgi:hypothetical protein